MIWRSADAQAAPREHSNQFTKRIMRCQPSPLTPSTYKPHSKFKMFRGQNPEFDLQNLDFAVAQIRDEVAPESPGLHPTPMLMGSSRAARMFGKAIPPAPRWVWASLTPPTVRLFRQRSSVSQSPALASRHSLAQLGVAIPSRCCEP